MKKLTIFALLALASLNCHARSLTAHELSAVEESIKNDLKDPYSVVFYHDDYPYPEKNMIYCAKYNAKNSYGAYTGKKLFAVMILKNNEGKLLAPRMDVNSSTGEERDETVTSSICASAGYDIPVSKMFFKDVNKARANSGIPELSKQFLRN